MGLRAWLILLAASADLALAARYTIFHTNHKPADHVGVYIVCGALLGGFTANIWYPGIGPALDGLYLLPALAGAIALGVVVVVVHRLLIRLRQPGKAS